VGPALLAAIIVFGACSPSTVRPSGATGPPPVIAFETIPPTPTPDPTPLPSAIPTPGHELYGFVPYWEMDDTIAAHLRSTPLTTLALFSVSTTASGAISPNLSGYRRITGSIGRQLVAEAHARKTRVELVYTSFGNENNKAFFADPARMEASIASVVRLVGELGMDGVNLDVEGMGPDLVPMYGVFVARLKESIVAANPAGTLSVATTGGELGAAMGEVAIDVGADRDFLMGYDYHYSGSSPGASAPILRSDGGEKSLTWSLDRYVALGVPPERTILGLPLYGMVWPVTGPGLGAIETGAGATWILRKHVQLLTDPAVVPVIDPVEQVDVYFEGSDGSIGMPSGSPGDGVIVGDSPSPSGSPDGSPAAPTAPPVTWQAVYVDSPATLAPKMGLADDRGLAGAGFWAIGYERGLPAYTDLMRRFVAGDALS
jgi:hypothetical protein